ncbi:hypothetical protein PPL_08512 [Heterostelium album PN500]|uniref:Hikeshi-like N-terminal domain-containing protein n=1 Tax=Heterostelium pallidum (strain ATCC 26659 / Pp 5 / PN500) TaxID=670386 RepID=D3BIE2_HETP5|nr:hypothetical protein PPL_08512 [Heterostelium album PN500]EFA79042.1 hypothetical protein PPL_08512 [Heterostelium album PN500]|eukprot:XP_020431165.1 hypothetical protein PPL_08512 [Heterostelium album PN500]
MFGYVISGRPVQPSVTQLQPGKFFFQIDDATNVHNFAVFLTEQNFPAGYGAAIYLSYTPFQDWKYLGFINSLKPSAFFSILQEGDMTMIDQSKSVAQVGISIETEAEINAKQKTNAASDNTTFKAIDFKQYAFKMCHNFVNYVLSFAVSQQQQQQQELPPGTKLLKNGVAVNGWVVTTSKKPILNSTEKEEWERELQLNELPEMVFGNNYVSVAREDNSFSIVFNTHDALSLCKKTADQTIKVAASARWQAINQGTFTGPLEKSFEWTFTTPYNGSVLKDGHIYTMTNRPQSIFETTTTEQIDIEKLKRPDPILFYDDVILFEDELADNGISMLSVKVRAMPTGIFVLQRFFLRVDDVLLRCYDTRLYLEFGNSYFLMESMLKEANYDLLKPIFDRDPTFVSNVNMIVQQLPIKSLTVEKIKF